ncbi:hypothetical protein PDIG_49930 [Penicillium digitatum PHI26]|uniref:Uncharacterized protein n=2 Tax=Penicillium digitatum TaxID=36651 RepID=K9FPB1_PEND2|nr:hypothetical protein PDIP_19160 [Penicillium digitatum Pd1]EKV11460.1 hypothetical protein PDIG_49930 [Penicillium digitatum PHI26]EKV20137.1 hypothetical protein PDIP_19160 [Penicillium digitatum Pd1]
MRMDIGLDTRGQGLIDQDYSRYRRIDEHRCLCIRSRCAGHTAWGVERTHRDRANHLSSALMGSYFLREEINVLGKLGCAACLLGSVLLVLHAPGDKEIETIDEILHLAIQPC